MKTIKRMNRSLCRPLCLGLVAAILIVAFGATSTAARPKKDDYKKHPGFVDFDRMGIFGDAEATVEIFLKGSLINMAKAAIQNEDPALAAVLDGIKLVRVNVFDLEDDQSTSFLEKSEKMAEQLDKRGWELAVRVREKDEQVYIYLLPGKNDEVNGLVVMVIGEDNEAVFINIVGDIDPAEIGRIGHAFNLDQLEGHWNDKHDRHYDHDTEDGDRDDADDEEDDDGGV